MTGLTFFNPELAAKRLELLKEAMPELSDVGILLNLTNPMKEPVLSQMNRVAQSLKLELHQFDVHAPDRVEGAFGDGSQTCRRARSHRRCDIALQLSSGGRARIEAAFASCGWSDFAIDGGLMAYGVDFLDMFRRAAFSSTRFWRARSRATCR